MASKMKTVAAPKPGATAFVVHVDPLAVSRGHRVLPRGRVHDSARRPGRARAKGQWRRQQQSEGRLGNAHQPGRSSNWEDAGLASR